MLSTQEELIRSVLSNPTDLVLRLVYADWLEERGQPNRAECLRAEVSAAGVLGSDRVRSVLDVERHFGHRYSEDELRRLAIIPHLADTLVACKGTHVLFPGAPISLERLRACCSRSSVSIARRGRHSRAAGFALFSMPFASEPVDTSWILLRTSAPLRAGATSRTRQPPAPGERPARPCEMIYGWLLYLLGLRSDATAEWYVWAQGTRENGAGINILVTHDGIDALADLPGGDLRGTGIGTVRDPA